MTRTRKYYLKNNYLTLRSKVPRRSLRYATPPYDHAPTYQISLTYLERRKCYGPDKKILFKKQLFDLEVKGQGPTKVITVCDTPSYGHAPTYQISLTYLERQPEALKSLYRSPGYKKKQLVLCKNYVLQW